MIVCNTTIFYILQNHFLTTAWQQNHRTTECYNTLCWKRLLRSFSSNPNHVPTLHHESNHAYTLKQLLPQRGFSRYSLDYSSKEVKCWPLKAIFSADPSPFWFFLSQTIFQTCFSFTSASSCSISLMHREMLGVGFLLSKMIASLSTPKQEYS